MSEPTEAEIEAAAIALARNHRGTLWERISRERQEEFLADARDALEAAARVRAAIAPRPPEQP